MQWPGQERGQVAFGDGRRAKRLGLSPYPHDRWFAHHEQKTVALIFQHGFNKPANVIHLNTHVFLGQGHQMVKEVLVDDPRALIGFE